MIIEALDSLTNLFYEGYEWKKPLNPRSGDFAENEIPEYNDSIYQYRLSVVPSPIDMVYNNDVKRFIDLYNIHRRGQVEKMLGLSQIYFPEFEAALDKYDLPMELKYLPIIESALNPHAVSRVGATGLWQFMYSTARMYGLKVNSYVDERRDPSKATDAAARFLKDLHDLYGDWSLAIAAYNCGPGNLNKAIRRSGGKTNYWEIRRYLPRETRGYLPAFIAATYTMQYHEEHNLYPMVAEIYFEQTDTVHITKEVELSSISKYVDVETAELYFLNPALKRKTIPFTGEPYALNLPYRSIAEFDTYRDSIYALSPEKIAAIEKTETKSASTSSTKKTYNYSNYKPYVPNISGKTKLYYTIKSGDNLGFISEWYDTKITDIKYWNNIHGSRIWAGQKLSIYVPENRVAEYRNIENMAFEKKQAIEAKRNNTTYTKQATEKSSTPDRYIHYTIKPGDTLWDICQKYPKNSVEDLKRVNNITDLGVIKPGYVIKVGI